MKILGNCAMVAASLLASVSLSATAQAQSKQPIVAVAQIDDNAGSGQSKTLTQMMLTAIAATQKFRVMERGQLDVMVQEQQRAKSGLVTSRNGGKVGGFEGADYLIYGTITTLSVTKKSNFGASLGMAMLAGNNSQTPTNCYSGEVTLSLDIRITDSETGQIRYVKRIDEKKKAGTICGEGVPQVNATELLRSAADKVATGLVTAVYPIKVANAQPDGTLMLNYGEGTVALNDYVAIFRAGESVIDPDTGRALGSSEQRIGVAQITDVQTSFSKARPLAGFETPAQARDIARLATDDDLAAYPKAKLKRK
ncbi:CsgG/HfaB family protein [Novosphingobium sp. NPDC080210]|uniref:CsgG/HfaB family protein n=1 Tax=Novosphingobium sp. NPDC080210 TaxID=3390596 RepID=UPI003D06F7FC